VAPRSVRKEPTRNKLGPEVAINDASATTLESTNAARALEDGSRRPLAINDAAAETLDTGSDAMVPTTDARVPTINGVKYMCKYMSVKLSHFLVPGVLVLFVAAGDGQTQACEQLAHDRFDLALGESLGLICSTLFAVLLGGFLKWYIHDTHLLLYMGLLFFAEMIICVQGSIVDMLQKDLPVSSESEM